MTFDPQLSLTDRLELDQVSEKVVRHEHAREVRIAVRQRLITQIQEAQKKIVTAEDEARRHLPTPLTAEAIKAIVDHPEVLGRRCELQRLVEEFIPIMLEHAELVAAAIEADGSSESTPSSSQPGKKVRMRPPSHGPIERLGD